MIADLWILICDSRYVYGVSCRVRAKSYPRLLLGAIHPKVGSPVPSLLEFDGVGLPAHEI